MGSPAHSAEQGIRLHYLANLGGLVAVAGLDHHPPDLLLGILLDVASRVPQLSEQHVADLSARGQARLDERAAEKRAWSAWHRARQFQRLDLTIPEIKRLLSAITGDRADTAADPARALLAALRGKR